MGKRFTIIDPRYDTPYCGLANLPETHPALMRCVPVNNQPGISELAIHESTTVKDQGHDNKHVMALRVVRVDDAE